MALLGGTEMKLTLMAMKYAHWIHREQVRKYTYNPYADHLAEVVGIAMSVGPTDPDAAAVYMAIAWLHDSMEDQGIEHHHLVRLFGTEVADGVRWLSDLEQGNRAERKAASRDRLAQAPAEIQTIKVADMLSNTSSIVMHDKKFAVTYLEEKRLMLDVLTKADPDLVVMARQQTTQVDKELTCP